MKNFRQLAFLFILMFAVKVSAQGVEHVKETKTSYNSIIDMIRREPGVTIVKGTGDDGTMPTMYIRGIGTNSSDYQPLFVVDGLKTDNILYVEPDNVYSITVIKDGTSSIYGMEGANGVIEIKTKGAVEAEKEKVQEKKENRKSLRNARKFRKKKVEEELESSEK